MRKLLKISLLLTLSLYMHSKALHGYSDNPLYMGSSAEAIAVGKSYVSLSADGSGILYNPAGLFFQKAPSYYSYFVNGLLDSYGSFLSYSDKIHGVNGAVSTLYYNYGSIKHTDLYNNVLGYIHPFWLCPTFSVAFGKDHTAIGVNTNFIYETHSTEKSLAFGADIGLQYRETHNSFGLFIKNVVAPSVFSYSYKRFIDAGYSYSTIIKNTPLIFSISKKIYTADDISVLNFNVGIQAMPLKNLRLSLGRSAGNISGGITFSYKNVSIEYAVLNSSIGTINLIGLKYQVGHQVKLKTKVERKPKIRTASETVPQKTAVSNNKEQLTLYKLNYAQSIMRSHPDSAVAFLSAIAADTNISDTFQIRIANAIKMASNIKKARELFNKGLTLYQAAQFNDAIVLWKKAKKLDAQNEQISAYLESALLTFEKINEIQNKAKIIADRLIKAQFAFNNGFFKQTLAYCSEALAIEPNNKDALSLKNKTLTEIKKNKLHQIQEKEKHEKSMRLLNNAKKLIASGNYNAALLVLKKINSGPFVREASELIIRCNTKIQNILMEKDPENQKLYNEAAKLYTAGKMSEAAAKFKKLYEKNPNYRDISKKLNDSLLYAGIIYYRNNELQSAINTWEQLLHFFPNSSSAQDYITRAKNKLGGNTQ